MWKGGLAGWGVGQAVGRLSGGKGRGRSTHLVGEHLGTEVSQRDLELLAVSLELDLDDNERVERHWDVGGHGGQRVRLTG